MTASRCFSLSILFIFLSLASCANAQGFSPEQQQYQQEKAQCEQEPLTRKNVMQRQDCVNKSLANHALREGVPASVVYQRTASDMQAAVAYAEGKITALEYRAALEQSKADFMRSGEAYLAAQDQQRSQNWQNAWGGIANYFQQQQAIQNAARPPTPTNTFCVQVSGGLSCRTQ